MEEEHQHVEKQYTFNNELVCDDCHPKTETGEKISGNECFCSCHKAGDLRCRMCMKFHIPATEK